MAERLARADAAPQRRGPHPLPAFLNLALRVTGGDRDRMAAVLRGIRAYQQHGHARPTTPAPVAARVGSSRLLDLGGSGPPLVMVPSLINANWVLDLGPDLSLMRHLGASGVRALLLDWGSPDPAERSMSLDELVTERLLPLIAALGERPILAGYCLGATIAIAAAALAPPRKLALLAAPWRFCAYPQPRRNALLQLWAQVEPAARDTGVLPVELLQPGFWELDPHRSVKKFERFGILDPASPDAAHYVAVEDWVNSGPPIGVGAARHIFERFFRDDEPGSGRWIISGQAIDPASLSCPVLNVIAARDQLVPAATAPQAGERLNVNAGHVGMVVGRRARAVLWEPLARWLTA